MSEKPTCAQRVSDSSGGWYPRTCALPAKYEEGGKHWCGTHLPSKAKARRAKRDAKWEAKWEAKQERAEAENVRAKTIESARDALIAAALAWDEVPDIAEAINLFSAADAYRKATEGDNA